MLAYNCENCNKIILWGCINEFEQHFCDEICYRKYCEKNGYIPNYNKLYHIKTFLNDHT